MYLFEDVPLVEFMYLVFTRMYFFEDVPLVEFMYLVFTRMYFFEDVPLVEFMYLYLLSCQVRVTVGDSSLCCCACMTSHDSPVC